MRTPDPVISWTTSAARTRRTSLADVLVCRPGQEVDADLLGKLLLHRHPGVALVLLVVPVARILVWTEDRRSLELHREAPWSACLEHADAVESAAVSLHAWIIARVDLGALLRHGLPLWCGPHRDRRSARCCGRLGVDLVPRQRSQSSSHLLGP